MNILKAIKIFHKRIKIIGDAIIEKAAIHIVFFVGIGTTFILSLILRKKFLDKDSSSSGWRAHVSLGDHKKMF